MGVQYCVFNHILQKVQYPRANTSSLISDLLIGEICVTIVERLRRRIELTISQKLVIWASVQIIFEKIKTGFIVWMDQVIKVLEAVLVAEDWRKSWGS